MRMWPASGRFPTPVYHISLTTIHITIKRFHFVDKMVVKLIQLSVDNFVFLKNFVCLCQFSRISSNALTFLAGGTKKNQPDRVNLLHQLSKSNIESLSDAKMSKHCNSFRQSAKLSFLDTNSIIDFH